MLNTVKPMHFSGGCSSSSEGAFNRKANSLVEKAQGAAATAKELWEGPGAGAATGGATPQQTAAPGQLNLLA